MTVIYNELFYSMEMTQFMFRSIKMSQPDYEVELFLLVDSNYKYLTRVRIGDVKEWCVGTAYSDN